MPKLLYGSFVIGDDSPYQLNIQLEDSFRGSEFFKNPDKLAPIIQNIIGQEAYREGRLLNIDLSLNDEKIDYVLNNRCGSIDINSATNEHKKIVV